MESVHSYRRALLESIDVCFQSLLHGTFDSPYGPVSLDTTNEKYLQTGFLKAHEAICCSDWSYPVKLMNGKEIRLSAPLMLYMYGVLSEYQRSLKRRYTALRNRACNAQVLEDIQQLEKELACLVT